MILNFEALVCVNITREPWVLVFLGLTTINVHNKGDFYSVKNVNDVQYNCLL